MPRFQTSHRPPSSRAPTCKEQIQALVDALRRVPTHDLSVQEVFDLAIRGITTINEAHKLIREYTRQFGDATVRYDLCATGRVRVVCLYQTSRRDRRWRA